ncbi:MAG: SGNH/GDSL hydrolase family protein [Pirellulales bacterium]
MNQLRMVPHQAALFLLIIMFGSMTVQAQSKKVEAILNGGVDLKVGSLLVNRILFLGNSITLHGPAANIGWTDNWGMAASSEEKDFVHLLTDQVAKAAGGKPKIMVRNIADFERGLASFDIQERLKEELAFQPDVVILAIGENCATPVNYEAKIAFSTALDDLLNAIEKNGKPKVFVRSQFWAEPTKDGLLKAATLKHQHIWVDLNGLIDESCNARSERKIDHAGVAGHPGDKGMQVIADTIMKAIVSQSK